MSKIQLKKKPHHTKNKEDLNLSKIKTMDKC